MSLYLPNRAKYGVASAPGTSTTITLGTLVPGFIPLNPSGFPTAGLPVVYYAEDTISGSAVVEIGDATLNYSAGIWSLTNRNPYEQSNGSTTLLTLTSAALIGFSLRAGDFFGFYGGDVNKFRNGLFDIWQRGTSISVSTSGAYTADGWIVTPTGAPVTVTQDSTRGNADNLLALKIQGAASVTDVKLIQRIESYIAAPLAGQPCTVRFKVYNGKASGSLTPQIKVDDASSTDNFGSVTADLAATNLQVCANAAWTDVAYSFVANANAIKGMQVTLDFGALGSGDNVEVTAADIRLTPYVLPPSVTGQLCATPPLVERRPIHRELAFCERYYEILFYDSLGGGGNGYSIMMQVVDPAEDGVGVWTFKTTKRSNPSISLISGSYTASATWYTSLHKASYWAYTLTNSLFSVSHGTAGNIALAASSEL